MKAPLRFGIAGLGAISGAYEQAFATITEARLVAACDVREEVVRGFAARNGCEPFTAPAQMAERMHLDAVVVCTPPATHEPVAVDFMDRGVNVLCEKPLAINPESAGRMMDAARRNRVLLTMASKFRYVRDVRLAKRLLDKGAIGDLVFIENAFTSHVNMAQRWNSDPRIAGGGVLMDNGTHAVDILRYFMGALEDVQIVEGRRIQGLPVEDTVRVFVRNHQGVMGTSDLSWSIDKEMSTYLRLYGSQGTILVGWQQSKFRRRGKSMWHIFGNGYDKVEAFRNQILNFCGAISGESELLVTPRDALASVEVISAAYAALERSRWETISTQIEDVLANVPMETQ